MSRQNAGQEFFRDTTPGGGRRSPRGRDPGPREARAIALAIDDRSSPAIPRARGSKAGPHTSPADKVQVLALLEQDPRPELDDPVPIRALRLRDARGPSRRSGCRRPPVGPPRDRDSRARIAPTCRPDPRRKWAADRFECPSFRPLGRQSMTPAAAGRRRGRRIILATTGGRDRGPDPSGRGAWPRDGSGPGGERADHSA